MNRSMQAILARSGNEREQAFAHGYKTITKGIREHTAYKRKSHHNHSDYLDGKRVAKLHAREARR